jgi:hypothetical protein
LQTMSVVPLYLSIPLFMKRGCVQKYGLIHMEDAVKTVTNVVKDVDFKTSHFELPLTETETDTKFDVLLTVYHYVSQ